MTQRARLACARAPGLAAASASSKPPPTYQAPFRSPPPRPVAPSIRSLGPPQDLPHRHLTFDRSKWFPSR